MREKVEVSVICLAYNHESYIEKCLEGFVTQKTNFRFEIIIHDDASTDNTVQIIKRYVERYPDLFIPIYQEENQQSKGVRVIRDFMFPIARGKYIAWCEGDDYWCDENKLQTQFDILENNKECALSAHIVKKIYEDGSDTFKTIPDKRFKFNAGELSKEETCNLVWCQGYPFQTSSYFFKKEILKEFLNNEIKDLDLLNGDMIFLRMAAIYGTIYYIDMPMSCYRVMSKGSWTSTHPVTDISDVHKRFLKAIKAEKGINEYTGYKYDKYIKTRIAAYVLAWSDAYPDEAKRELKLDNIGLSIILKQLPLKYAIYYILLYTCPKLHTIIKKYFRK